MYQLNCNVSHLYTHLCNFLEIQNTKENLLESFRLHQKRIRNIGFQTYCHFAPYQKTVKVIFVA